jgi:hypothetical protein
MTLMMDHEQTAFSATYVLKPLAKRCHAYRAREVQLSFRSEGFGENKGAYG